MDIQLLADRPQAVPTVARWFGACADGLGPNSIGVGSSRCLFGGVLAVAESPAYCVSKAGLGMLTKTMALALAPHGIRVNAIGPGPTTTPMTANLPPEAIDMMLSRTPLGRFGDATEMAGVAAFLASDDAGFVTGQTIYADGGRLALNYLAQKPIDS